MGNIKDIKELNLKKIFNKNGNILRGIRVTSYKTSIKEVYFSKIKLNKIKGWKYHKRMQLRICVPVGKVKFIFFDGKKFLEKIIGENNYKLLIIPPKIWFCFKGLNKKESLIVNMPDILHNKKEQKTLELKNIKYDL